MTDKATIKMKSMMNTSSKVSSMVRARLDAFSESSLKLLKKRQHKTDYFILEMFTPEKELAALCRCLNSVLQQL